MAKSWRKIILSGSAADLQSASGSFSGSFVGDGSGLTGIAGAAADGAVNRIQVSDGAGAFNSYAAHTLESTGITLNGATSAFVNLDRNATTNTAQIVWYTGGSSRWALGTEVGGEDFVIWNNGTPNDYVFRTSYTTNLTHFPDKVEVSASFAVGAASASATVGRIDASNDVVNFSSSDINFKNNIFVIEDALFKVNQIRGVEFEWNEEPEISIHHGYSGPDVGVIAQEVVEVLPEVVTTRKSGHMAVKYEKIIPLLIEAIKELHEEVEELKKKAK